jgi:hypothetical protein
MMLFFKSHGELLSRVWFVRLDDWVTFPIMLMYCPDLLVIRNLRSV